MRRPKWRQLLAALAASAALYLVSGALLEPFNTDSTTGTLRIKSSQLSNPQELVIVVPGWGNDEHSFDSLLPYLQARATVMVVGYPRQGFDLSLLMLRVKLFIEMNQPKHVKLLGVSMGALVAQQLGEYLRTNLTDQPSTLDLLAAFPAGDPGDYAQPQFLMRLLSWPAPVGVPALVGWIGERNAQSLPYPREAGVDLAALQQRVARIWQVPWGARAGQLDWMLSNGISGRPAVFNNVIIADVNGLGAQYPDDGFVSAAASRHWCTVYPAARRVPFADNGLHDTVANYPSRVEKLLGELGTPSR